MKDLKSIKVEDGHFNRRKQKTYANEQPNSQIARVLVTDMFMHFDKNSISNDEFNPKTLLFKSDVQPDIIHMIYRQRLPKRQWPIELIKTDYRETYFAKGYKVT